VKVSTEERADRQAVIQIEVEEAELEQALERAYRRVVRQVNINGFRPGKAPRHIVERRLGKVALIDEAARELVPKLTSEAIEEHKIDAIAEPQVEITTLEPLAFTATVPLRPVVVLGDFTAIRVMPREVEVTEAQVDEVIDRLRQQRGEWVTPDPARPAQDGDQVLIDMTSRVDDEELDAPQLNQPAVLGEPSGLIPELQAAIRGREVGDAFQVTVDMPEDHGESRVAGKTVTFDLTLNSIQGRRLPELDDAFAASVSDLATVEALRERVRENLEAKARDDARQAVTQAVIDLVTDQATVEMPPILIDNQVERQIDERRQYFERQGLSWRRLLEITNRTEEQIQEEERPQAERRVRSSLTLLEIAKHEAIAVTPDEVDAEIDRMVAGVPEAEAARQQYARPQVRQAVESGLFEQKILDRLIEVATEGRGAFVGPGEASLPAALMELDEAEPMPVEATGITEIHEAERPAGAASDPEAADNEADQAPAPKEAV
jgi:trigger factor